MARFPIRLAAVAAIAVAALSLTACSGGRSSSASSSSTSASTDVKTLTKTPGKLTIATSEPAYSPWVENDDPASGEGYEAAVAYAVADQLGFSKDDVIWTRTDFDSAITPGAKDWDLNIQQFTITDERKQAVDFSSPYYTATQAVVTYAGSPADGLTSIADLQSVKFGVTAGTTSLTTVEDEIAPTTEASQFNTEADTIQALINKQVDAIVVNLPEALYIVSAELDNGVIVGQLADAGQPEELGIVLQKNSALTDPVSAAVDTLRANGTLDALATKWLSSNGTEIAVLQ